MSDPRPSRRALLKGATTTGAAAALLAMPAAALQPDPVFAAIKLHAAARARLNDMDSEDAGWDVALDEEGALWEAFCECRPATMDGLVAYAAHAAAYPDLPALTGKYGPSALIRNMAEALRLLRGASA